MAITTTQVECPCCRTIMVVDRESGRVLTHREPEKPQAVEDIGEAVQRLKGEEARREELFQKSFADQKSRKSVLNRKFDELLKQAKSGPADAPPKRTFDFD